MKSNPFSFKINQVSGQARVGTLSTAHGRIETPTFMPVGTAGTIKAMTPEAVAKTGAQMILSNTYHLMLRPGADRIDSFGGLHKFMNWDGPILTDSGGFQIMSLSGLRELNEEGVIFKSHIDGSSHALSPEKSVTLQHRIGSDITMVLDECISFPASFEKSEDSMLRSMRWAKRCKSAFINRDGYGLFGIVQGGTYPKLRSESAAELIDIGFDGYAIGGLAVGEEQDIMFETLDSTVPSLPIENPRYLMGVGKPSDLVGAVERGIDMFDCVLPTRSGRTSQAFTNMGQINLRNAHHRDNKNPIDTQCKCYTCLNYSRGYIHHLIMSKEILGLTLLTWHNLHYYQDLMQGLRNAIIKRSLNTFKQKFLKDQEVGDLLSK